MQPNQHKKILITTAIDYTNDVIHIGHSYQKILADCLIRYYRNKLGKENTHFLTGSDEYGTTNEKAAKARNLTPKEHVDDISAKNKEQLALLNISYDRYIRTTDADHNAQAQHFFSTALANGDVYKGSYSGLYCEGCESYKTLSELNEQGQCLLHPTREIQKTEEENYFFKWSKYSDFLLDILNNPRFVLPEGKRKEMISFVQQGLKDLPISRPKYKVSWGIPIPNDPDQVIYVWFDALVNYFTEGNATGFWDDDTEIIHILGKDNARWHALLWPAMLKSVGYRLPDTIYAHGFINLNGDKISKSRGNFIRTEELVNQFGCDAVRYYFLKHGPIVEDVNISVDHIKEVYNSDLANGLGNTVARLAKLAERSGFDFEPITIELEENDLWNDLRVDLILQGIWSKLSDLDKHINENEPWKITDQTKLKEVLTYEINELRKIAKLLEPFIPETSTKIQTQFGGAKIAAVGGLFPRL